MTSLDRAGSRWVWRWCVLYTAIAPGGQRSRRREEIRSHLWESEHVGLLQRDVLMASVRGMAADLSWAAGVAVVAALRGLLTPAPYVVLAGACPIVAWLVSAFASRETAQPFEALGGVGGAPFLLVALLMWRRGHSGR